ncbi:MAG: septum formation initiator family protein, partial [Deltaproteobacteria bacterium]|nr:septum formation initiator family protein [Deltaproteobacteria bacterium]
ISSLSTEIDRAKNDPAYIEAVARQELGMIGKDEVILKFNKDMKNRKIK